MQTYPIQWILLGGIGLSLVLGKYGLSWSEVWQAVTFQGGRRVELAADRRIRRALAAVVFGACLAIIISLGRERLQ